VRVKDKSGLAYLPIRHLAKALKDLLRRILILSNADHESDKLLKRHEIAPAARRPEPLVHLHLVVHEPEAGQRGGELEFVQGVGQVAVEVAEDGFEFLQLDRGQVRHVARHHLVLEEGELLGHAGFDQAELVFELVVGVGGEVVFFDVRLLALLVDGVDGVQEGVEWGEVFAQSSDVPELVFDVTFEAGYCEG